PQLFLGAAVGAAGLLPRAPELTERRRGRPPVGRRSERLGLGGQFLLARPGFLALLLEAGEIRLSALGGGGARRGQPLPQRGLDRAVAARCGLPLVEQLAHPLAADLPVRGLGRDALG